MNKGYKYAVLDCPVCSRSIADNWYIRHMRIAHSTTGAGDLTEAEIKAIRTSVRRDGYYSWADLQYEQHEDF